MALKKWVQSRVRKIQQIKHSLNQVVSFYHIPSQDNLADILTRCYVGKTGDLPYVCNVIPETDQAVLYSDDTTNIQSLPELNTRQIVNNKLAS